MNRKRSMEIYKECVVLIKDTISYIKYESVEYAILQTFVEAPYAKV